MTDRVVVLGAGYAGASAIETLERVTGSSRSPNGDGSEGVELVWISAHDYHLVLHEVHRAIRDPSVRDHIAIPIDEIKSPSTTFIEAEVAGIDVDERRVELVDRDPVPYDRVLVALGSDTAFYGIPGLREHAFTLKGFDDALSIHEALSSAASAATPDEPVRVVVGGAGLSGVQTAGEIAEYRDETGTNVRITLVEALDDILPAADRPVREAVHELLRDRRIEVCTGDPVTEVGPDRIERDEGDPIAYDLFVWTGGITGREAMADAEVETNHARVATNSTFETTDERVFAVGDAAIVDDADGAVPPTAQAAWSAADVAAENVVRSLDGRPLDRWAYRDRGTVLSVGESAVAHDVDYVPVSTFDSAPARWLKKFIAARWIADVTSWSRALRAWGSL